ncbi:MAG: HAD-IIB family hydrolase [Geitlerinemataceae cyanobacterium]
MATPAPAIVFTDLDGTLLNARDYRYDAAISVLDRLKAAGIPTIPVTSKTRAEVELLRSEIGLSDPFVVENGSGIFIPEGDDRFPLETELRADGYRIVQLGGSYQEARDRVSKLSAKLGVQLCGFGDLAPEDIYGITGLAIDDAKLAQTRDFTEPFVTPHEFSSAEIATAAESLGFHVVVGDRFSHAIDPKSGKGVAVETLIESYANAGQDLAIVGLGNSPNDLPMLEAVPQPIVIPDEAGEPHPGLAERVALGWSLAPKYGCAGWALAVGEVLDKLGVP